MEEVQEWIIDVRAIIVSRGRIVLIKRECDDRLEKPLWELPGGEINKSSIEDWPSPGVYLLFNGLIRLVKKQTNLFVGPDEIPTYIHIGLPEKQGEYSRKATLTQFYWGGVKDYTPVCREDIEQIGLFGIGNILRSFRIPHSHRQAIIKTCSS